jgi:hypothetical protein
MEELVQNQKNDLLGCQLASGTFRLAPDRTQINPYFTNLALIALVQLGELKPVQQHVAWYLNNRNPQGYVNDFRIEDGREVDTGTADSEDSYHATLLSLLAEAVRQTEETEWIASCKADLADVFDALTRLQQKDGLTWAKHSYRVKYLMDNCEVWQGLEDASFLFHVLGMKEKAREAKRRADACRNGIASMYSEWRGAYAIYDRTYPGWRKWYPDVTSQAFPIVYRLAAPDTCSRLYANITGSFPHFDVFQTGDFYPWMIMGECARLMNDERRVERMLSTATDLYIYGPRRPYWLIHEAGRFLQLCKTCG